MYTAFMVIADGTQPPMTTIILMIIGAEPDTTRMGIVACFHNAVCLFVALVLPVDACIPETINRIAQFWN